MRLLEVSEAMGGPAGEFGIEGENPRYFLYFPPQEAGERGVIILALQPEARSMRSYECLPLYPCRVFLKLAIEGIVCCQYDGLSWLDATHHEMIVRTTRI